MKFPAAPSPTILVRDAQSMQALGESLARALRAGDVLLLEGELGAGKTTLAQGIGRALGIATPITSPTFVLLIEHEEGAVPLLHLDAYRLDGLSYEEGREAGLEEFFSRRDAILLIEWPSMIEEWIRAFRPEEAIWRVRIEHEGEARRVQVLAPAGREVEVEVEGDGMARR